MKKPNNWENTQAYGDFEPLELGGHVCKIRKVEETQSRTGKAMLIISLDIAEGEQKDYYAEQYKNDTRENKRWGCIVYQLVEDNDGNTNKGLKTFINAVEKSNKGFDQNKIWNDDFPKYFTNKLIGGVFGKEQYRNNSGALKWATKCFNFRDVEAIKKGVPVPEDRYLDGQAPQKHANSFTVADFEDIDTDDSDLPF